MKYTRTIVLIEYYFTQDGDLNVFIVRPELQKPIVEQIDVKLKDIVDPTATYLDFKDNASLLPYIKDTKINLIIEPVLRYTNVGEILCIVPHSVLHKVPFHAIMIGDIYLVDRNPVCYSPSVSIMKYCQSKRKKTPPKKAVAVADADGSLPGSRSEAYMVNSLFKTKMYLEKDATKENLVKEFSRNVGECDVLHFACHGYFDKNNPLRSGLQLWNTMLTARDILNLNINANLVTLSACESGVSQHGDGDELLGFMRSFLYSGTSSILLTGWRVDDMATEILMSEFYRLWKLGDVKVDALAKAQLFTRSIKVKDILEHYENKINRARTNDQKKLAHQSKSRVYIRLLAVERDLGSRVDLDYRLFFDPYYWAGFFLVGDWK